MSTNEYDCYDLPISFGSSVHPRFQDLSECQAEAAALRKAASGWSHWKAGILMDLGLFFTLHEAWWHTPFFRLILIGEKSEDLDGSWLEGWFEMKRCQMIPGAAACRSRGEIGVPEGWTPLFREMPLKFHPNPSKIPAQETMWQPTRVGKRERERAGKGSRPVAGFCRNVQIGLHLGDVGIITPKLLGWNPKTVSIGQIIGMIIPTFTEL